MSVVDELQLIAYQGRRDGICVVGRTPEWYGNLADRIDAEYVELPVDKDGVPIKPGDTFYHKKWGEMQVHSIDLIGHRWKLSIGPVLGGYVDAQPDEVTHERPDSLERIADEMDKYAENTKVGGDKAADWADRICKLAKAGE